MPKVTYNGVIHNFPDDFSEAEIQAALASPPSAAQDPTTVLAKSSAIGGTSARIGAGQTWGDIASEALPTIGGVVGTLGGAAVGSLAGGIGAGPGAVAGAASGGALGKWGQQRIKTLRGREGVPATISGRLTEIGAAGAGQGLLEATGRTAANVLGRGARFFMNSALKPGLRVLTESGSRIGGPGKTLSARFPKTDIVGEALARGRPIRDAGLRTSEANLTKASATAQTALQTADRAGLSPIPVHEALGPARTYQTEIAQTHSPAQKGRLKKIIEEYETEYPAAANLELSTARKRHGYEEGERLLRTGKGPMGSQFQTRLAQGYQAGIETRLPKIKELNRETQSEMAVKDAIFAALNRESQSGRFSVSGALDNPRLWGTVAHGAKNLGTAARVSPQAGRAALLALMASHRQAD